MSSSKLDVFERIKYHFEELILKRAYLPGEFLPSVRKVSIDLGVNPNTVQKAYQMLSDEGFIEIIPKKGAYVKALKQSEKKELILSLNVLLNRLKAYEDIEDLEKMVIDILREDCHDRD